jgi:hypothetical protein
MWDSSILWMGTLAAVVGLVSMVRTLAARPRARRFDVGSLSDRWVAEQRASPRH